MNKYERVYKHTDFNVGDRVVLVHSLEVDEPQAGKIISKNDNNSFVVDWDSADENGWIEYPHLDGTIVSKNPTVFARDIIKENPFKVGDLVFLTTSINSVDVVKGNVRGAYPTGMVHVKWDTGNFGFDTVYRMVSPKEYIASDGDCILSQVPAQLHYEEVTAVSEVTNPFKVGDEVVLKDSILCQNPQFGVIESINGTSNTIRWTNAHERGGVYYSDAFGDRREANKSVHVAYLVSAEGLYEDNGNS